MTPEEIKASLAAKRRHQNEVNAPAANGADPTPPPAQARVEPDPLPEQREPRPARTRGDNQEVHKEPTFSAKHPHSIEIEMAFLGAMFQNPGIGVPFAKSNVTQDYFFGPAHRLFFDLATHYYLDQGELEFFAFQDYLAGAGHLEILGGRIFLTELKTGNYPAEALPYYLDILRDKYQRRELLRIKSEIEKRSVDETEDVSELISLAQLQLRELSATSAPKKSPLSVRKLSELTGMTFDDTDNYFGDRVIAAGQACTLLGPGGVGKSRLTLQLAICMITGRLFLDMETHAPDARWLFIQTENSNRRLSFDLKNITAAMDLSPPELALVEKNLFIHTLESELDTFLTLSNLQNYAATQSLIADVNPQFVEWDPLNSFTDADLNSDMDMRSLVSAIATITRAGNPNRVPFVLHHSLTGKAGAARAVGWDKSSYGRNSKVLQAWTRAQINLSPRSPDDPNLLIMSCGKNNNGAPFPEIGVMFHVERGFYVKDDSFDPEEFREEIGLATRKKPLTSDQVSDLVEDGIPRSKLIEAITAKHEVSKPTAYRAIDRAESDGKIRKEKGKNWNAIYFGVDAPRSACSD